MTFSSFFVCLLIAHFVGDFAFQTRWMGNNKSKNTLALLAHIGAYTTALMSLMFGATFFCMIMDYNLPAQWHTKMMLFLLINAVLHLVTDAITSRITSYFWARKNEKGFFTTIGFDQMVHAITLFKTSEWLYGMI